MTVPRAAEFAARLAKCAPPRDAPRQNWFVMASAAHQENSVHLRAAARRAGSRQRAAVRLIELSAMASVVRLAKPAGIHSSAVSASGHYRYDPIPLTTQEEIGMGKSQNEFVLQIPTRWKKKISDYGGGPTRRYPGRKVLIPAMLTRENFHRISVSGTTTMHDYETLGSDKEADFPFLRETVLSTHGPSQTLLRWQQGFGGEERTEIDMVGSLSSSTGACLFQIAVRFYEGATEGTSELEDSRVFETIVPVGRTSNFDVLLANDEDDWARVVGSIGNSAF